MKLKIVSILALLLVACGGTKENKISKKNDIQNQINFRDGDMQGTRNFENFGDDESVFGQYMYDNYYSLVDDEYNDFNYYRGNVYIKSIDKNGKVILKSSSGKRYTFTNEEYREFEENDYKYVVLNPLSTFSIDVDKASYSNVRRMINNGQEVPKDAVKLEEFINYFDYDYDDPITNDPFAIHTEVGIAPWNKNSKVVRIGIQGRHTRQEDFPASNLVFLLDVSGSMSDYNKLPLVKKSLKLLVSQLRKKDKVAIVVYAGAAGVVLPSTSGEEKETIIKAINNLEAGGSTAGGEGINLAYKIAEEAFIKKGNNRVILATDGDFNVGASSDADMETLIEDKRKSGVFLTCLGFGMGNYKDSKLETLAQAGNGNHGYIDTMQEAAYLFGKAFGGTLYTIAKDVKIQVEFNPAKVKGYRLIGYENRLLEDTDFNDDTKDAGELGSGHSVTALYEIIPQGINNKFLKSVDDLRYTATNEITEYSDELLTVKIRYKQPDGNVSSEIIKNVSDLSEVLKNDGYNFCLSVAMFGMYLRESEYLMQTKKDDIIALAEANTGNDPEGYRAEFIRLMKSYTP
ncbi:MAG: von Willebrand factor type A domain-containing protein [Flavobacteriaceae bacterium]|nr:von Willebrand factor type A domain-containing protein [Flavobacteriaceae bacterium]